MGAIILLYFSAKGYNKMKKILSAILAMMMVFSLVTMPAIANDEPSVSLTSSKTKLESSSEAQEILITVTLNNPNPTKSNIAGISFDLISDSEYLVISDKASSLTNAFGDAYILYNASKFIALKYAGFEPNPISEKSVKLMTVKATLKENAPVGTYKISTKDIAVANTDADLVFETDQSVTINVTENSTQSNSDSSANSNGNSNSIGGFVTKPVTYNPSGTASGWNNPFKDISENDWYFDTVKYIYQAGLMSGTSANTFAPNEDVTRAMFVTVLYRREGQPQTSASNFTDIEAGSWYEKAISWASANGIVNGATENEFEPDANITREQISAIMHRYAQYKGFDVTVGETADITSYTDAAAVSEYAVDAMKYVVGSGLINGKTATTLNPADNATRAEIAIILQRFITNNSK